MEINSYNNMISQNYWTYMFALDIHIFSFQDQYYLQVHGADSSMPGIVCNLYMEDVKTLCWNLLCTYLPCCWKRYVDGNVFWT